MTDAMRDLIERVAGLTSDAPMTPQIEELRGLLAKATVLPWEVYRHGAPSLASVIEELTYQASSTVDPVGTLYLLNAGGKCPAITGCGPMSEANAALIVAAVNTLPDLLAMITALAGERDGLRAALKPFADVAINVPFEPATEIVVWVPANERNGGRWTAHMPTENFINARVVLEGGGK